MHTNSRLLYCKYAINHLPSDGRVLEIGPDVVPSSYCRLSNRAALHWDTIDLAPRPNLTYVAESDYVFPLEDGAYDVVISGQVLEHVRHPWRWIQEIARVCRPGGLVITISPVSWPYHEAPVDCWRAYPDGMRALYEEASLEVVLSTWESLEYPRASYRIPGRSPEWQPRWQRLASRLLAPMRLPVECAFDTITIGRKP